MRACRGHQGQKRARPRSSTHLILAGLLVCSTPSPGCALERVHIGTATGSCGPQGGEQGSDKHSRPIVGGVQPIGAPDVLLLQHQEAVDEPD